jgi:hypothetical protein
MAASSFFSATASEKLCWSFPHPGVLGNASDLQICDYVKNRYVTEIMKKHVLAVLVVLNGR